MSKAKDAPTETFPLDELYMKYILTTTPSVIGDFISANTIGSESIFLSKGTAVGLLNIQGVAVGGLTGGYVGAKTGELMGRKIAEVTVGEEWVDTFGSVGQSLVGAAGFLAGGYMGLRVCGAGSLPCAGFIVLSSTTGSVVYHYSSRDNTENSDFLKISDELTIAPEYMLQSEQNFVPTLEV